MAKEKVNHGFLKEIKKTSKSEPKKPFTYSNPVNKLDKIKPVSLNLNQRAFKTMPENKSTNLKTEMSKGKGK